MNTQEVANRLVEFCRVGDYNQAYNELFAENAYAVEPKGAPVERTEGLQNLIQKSEQFANMVEEIHSNEVSEPVVAGNYFTVKMRLDTTMKGMGRQQMEEVCVYEVNNEGKIASEQFFYNPAPMPSHEA